MFPSRNLNSKSFIHSRNQGSVCQASPYAPVTHTMVSNASGYFWNSFTRGHILMASDRVLNTSMFFFIIKIAYNYTDNFANNYVESSNTRHYRSHRLRVRFVGSIPIVFLLFLATVNVGRILRKTSSQQDYLRPSLNEDSLFCAFNKRLLQRFHSFFIIIHGIIKHFLALGQCWMRIIFCGKNNVFRGDFPVDV